MPVPAHRDDPAQQPPVAVVPQDDASGNGAFPVDVPQPDPGAVGVFRQISRKEAVVPLQPLPSGLRQLPAVVEADRASGFAVQHVFASVEGPLQAVGVVRRENMVGVQGPQTPEGVVGHGIQALRRPGQGGLLLPAVRRAQRIGGVLRRGQKMIFQREGDRLQIAVPMRDAVGILQRFDHRVPAFPRVDRAAARIIRPLQAVADDDDLRSSRAVKGQRDRDVVSVFHDFLLGRNRIDRPGMNVLQSSRSKKALGSPVGGAGSAIGAD